MVKPTTDKHGNAWDDDFWGSSGGGRDSRGSKEGCMTVAAPVVVGIGLVVRIVLVMVRSNPAEAKDAKQKTVRQLQESNRRFSAKLAAAKRDKKK